MDDDDELFGPSPELEEIPDIEQPDFNEFFGADIPSEARERTGSDRISKPVMLRLAKSRLISVRARQLEDGAPSMIAKNRLISQDPIEIAKQELKERVIPIKIIRKFADGTYEVWTVSEFIYIAE